MTHTIIYEVLVPKHPKTKHAKLKSGDLVMIDWFDACCSTRAWGDDVNIHPCTSIGFLVSHSKKQLVIAHTKAEDGDYAGRFAIPRGFVKETKIVE